MKRWVIFIYGVASLALIALFAFWEPIGGVVWRVESPVAQALLDGGYAFGWMLLLWSTFLINHFDLFGLRQVWLQLRGRPYEPLPFKTPALYRYVHPARGTRPHGRAPRVRAVPQARADARALHEHAACTAVGEGR
jgi:hypothetical protein